MSSIGVVSGQELVAERGRRWAAAVGAEVTEAADVPSVRRVWRSAAAVVVDGHELARLAHHDLPRRDHVLVIADAPGDEVWRPAVRLGAVGVFAPDDDDAVTGALTAALDGRGEACVVSVVGATGGVGATTLVTACAQLAARRGVRALGLDADPHGPGLDLVAGAESGAGLRWHDISGADGHVGARALGEALPVAGGASLLSFARDAPASVVAGPVLSAVQRGFDIVVADVPRHEVGSVTGTDILARSAAAVLLVPEHVSGLAAARRLAPLLGDRCLVVTRTVPAGLGPREVERALERPVLARLPRQRRIAEDVEAGRGPGRSRPLRRAVGRVLDAVGVEA